MRARNIKPGFFKNDVLAEMSMTARLLFIGLWCLADRDGRLEKRPLRIKAEIFPYDNIKINGELTALERNGFIKTYHVDGQEYLQVVNFKTHQNPHHTEAKSKLPAITDGCIIPENSPLNNGGYPADSLIPDSLIQNPLSSSPDDVFAKFWKIYPRKEGKGDAEKAWKKIKKPSETFFAIEAALSWQTPSEQWTKDNGKFIPHPASYLNKRRWEDEPVNQTIEQQPFSMNAPDLRDVR